jgi:hypothetical protein
LSGTREGARHLVHVVLDCWRFSIFTDIEGFIENCNFYLDPDGGTAARLATSECPVLAKAARAKELENFIQ